MAERRRRPKNATPPALPGGDGGPTPDSPGFVRRLRRDLMQGERAVRWGMTPEMRAEWLQTAEKWRKHPNARVSLRALQLIAAIEDPHDFAALEALTAQGLFVKGFLPPAPATPAPASPAPNP